jgi:TolA-binding protein
MKKVLLICALSACLFSCSLLQRRGESGPEEEAEVQDTDLGKDAPLFTPTGQENGSGGEPEIARLNTKIAALETKLDVITASMERMQAQREQPLIHAEPQAQPSLAAPVAELQEIKDQPQTAQISAAPDRPSRLPRLERVDPGLQAAPLSSNAEREFREGMQLFQAGRNLEAASHFALMAQKYPKHLLAGHALYWAGEANAREKQWSLAKENWLELEKDYPRSAYLPEALAGLAKAFESQGDGAKGKYYRAILLRSFPKSPVALQDAPQGVPAAQAIRDDPSPAPVADDEEPVPVYEDDGGQKPEAP